MYLQNADNQNVVHFTKETNFTSNFGVTYQLFSYSYKLVKMLSVCLDVNPRAAQIVTDAHRDL